MIARLRPFCAAHYLNNETIRSSRSMRGNRNKKRKIAVVKDMAKSSQFKYEFMKSTTNDSRYTIWHSFHQRSCHRVQRAADVQAR